MSKFEDAVATYQTFAEGFQSLMLSTVSADGMPNASYAPFVKDEANHFYIFVSGLSTHTQNLHTVPKASILLIEDEQNTAQIFARRRLTLDCEATLLEREMDGQETEAWAAIANQFQARFGPMIEMLRGLSDFRIFQLRPFAGRFVLGFGAAYAVDPNRLNQLLPLQAEQN